MKRYEDDVDERDDDEVEREQKRPEKVEQRAIPEEEDEPVSRATFFHFLDLYNF